MPECAPRPRLRWAPSRTSAPLAPCAKPLRMLTPGYVTRRRPLFAATATGDGAGDELEIAIAIGVGRRASAAFQVVEPAVVWIQ